MLRLALRATIPCFFLACGSAESTAHSLEPLVDSATALHFTASTSIPSNAPPTVDLTVTNPAVVRAIFQETLDQPPFAEGTYTCPVDFGVTYHLVFTSGDTTTTADITPGGCQTLVLDGSRGALQPSAKYWADLATALGVGEAMIFPYAPPAK